MLTIQNFEERIGNIILKRGKKYYDDGCVISVEESDDGIWAAEVEGSAVYAVEIIIKDNEILDHSCDCPYDGHICKHVVATLLALRNELEIKPNKSATKEVFKNLLATLTAKDFRNFIANYAAGNKNFKTTFELFFADKDPRIDIEKKYAEIIQQLIRKHSERGYIHYKASINLSNELNNLLKTGNAYINKHNFHDAFAFLKGVLKPMMEVMMHCDDSSGRISGCIEDIVGFLEIIATSNEAATDIKEKILSFLRSQLNDRDYFEYGDFGYGLFAIFKDLAVQLGKSEICLDFIDSQLSAFAGKNHSYYGEYFQKEKIDILQQTGKSAEAEALVSQNMNIVNVRANEVNKAIHKKDFVAAKKLINEGIKIAKENNHPGTVAQWQFALLRIAYGEKDITTIRKYTKQFAFDLNFTLEYYQQWKATFTNTEWPQEIEKHIEETIQKITKEWGRSENKLWRQINPPLLHSLAPIYIQENFLDRLLALVQKEEGLDTILHYHPHLVKKYANELLVIYQPALEAYGVNANSRTQYADLVLKMKLIIKDIPEGKEKILNIARKLKERFSRKPLRPAMVQELDKIL